VVNLPRLVIAAPSTGQGKTTIATGLMAALRASGREVSGHKVGPDYIDPGYHALATGRPGRNLDPHLVGEDRIVPLLLHGARGADVALIEGVMGLYDGRLGTDGFASTAHVAMLTSSPVLLVLDVARQSRTVAAIAAGMAAFDPSVQIVGVVLNNATPGRNTTEIARALEAVGLPVLGGVPHEPSLAKPSRHLGLVPAVERGESEATIATLGEYVGRHVDLSAVLEAARSAPPLDGLPWDPAAELEAVGFRPADGPAPVVAMAGGRAFTFRYAETEELLRAAGCEIVDFDPLAAGSLLARKQVELTPFTLLACAQATADGIYLGGGFPEVYAEELATNRALLDELRGAVMAGVPTVAECAGLLLLAESLDGAPMAGAIRADAAMADRLTLRYPVAEAAADSLLTRAGEQVTGHEFHRTATVPTYPSVELVAAEGAGERSDRRQTPAWLIDGEPSGWAGDTLHASYLHVHWAGHPQLAARFVEAVRARG
jgi:cobyrinic acid a,c-diamide synthase